MALKNPILAFEPMPALSGMLVSIFCQGKLNGSLKHQHQCMTESVFQEVTSLKRKLIIFDLGYWDFNLFQETHLAGGFFLSRVKSGAVITVSQVVKGLGKQFIGEKLSSGHLNKET